MRTPCGDMAPRCQKEAAAYPWCRAIRRPIREGSVGWAADCIKIRLPDATEIPCRLTMVWHQENGCWKIVQSHLSIGVGDDDTEATCQSQRCESS